MVLIDELGHPFRSGVRALFLAVLLVSSACTDHSSPVLPSQEGLTATMITASESLGIPTRTDCALLRIRQVGGGVEAAINQDPGCEGEITAIVGNVRDLGIAKDGPPGRIYEVSLAVRNTTSLNDFGRPIALIADLSRLKPIQPSAFPDQAAGKGPPSQPINANGLTTAQHPIPNQPYWTFDSELDLEQQAPASVLEAGETTGERSIRITVHAGLREFTIPLGIHVSGELYRGLAVAPVEDPIVRAVAVHKDGYRFAAFSSSPNGAIDGALLRLPSGQTITVWADAEGRPAQALIADNIVVYNNWTSTTVDIAVIHPDGEIIVKKGLPIGAGATAMGAASASMAAASAVGAAASFPYMSTLARSAGLFTSGVMCLGGGVTALSGVLTPAGIAMAALACGGFGYELGLLMNGGGSETERLASTSISVLGAALDCASHDYVGCTISAGLIFLAALTEVVERIELRQIEIEEARQLLRPVTITVSPSVVSLLVGEHQQLVATVTGSPNTGALWMTDDSAVVRVDATGLATAVGPGETVIRARAQADVSKEAVAVVRVGSRVADPTARDLGTLGGSSSTAEDVNDSGIVVGWSTTGSGATHAFSWTQSGGMRDLGTLGGPRSFANAVNNYGTVVGASDAQAGGRVFAFLWTASEGMRKIEVAGACESAAVGINDAGQVAGTYTPCTSPGTTRSFIWTAATGAVDIGTLGGSSTRAFEISSSGVIVLRVNSCHNCNSAPYTWSAATGLQRVLLYGSTVLPTAINGAGQIVGSTNSGWGPRIFFWQPSFGPYGAKSCNFSGPAPFGSAYDVNEAGQMVGGAGNGAFFCQPGENATILSPLPGHLVAQANGINPGTVTTRKLIAGASQPVSGSSVRRAILWTMP